MDRNARLVRFSRGWKCRTCGFESPLDQEMALFVHQRISPQCLLDSPLDETQRTASASGSEHLESDVVIPAIRFGQHHPTSSKQPFAGAQYSQCASSVADLWSAPRRSDDMMVCDMRQRTSASRQHSNSFPQPPGRLEDEISADSGKQLLESDDVVKRRDIPREKERRKAPDQNLDRFRIERAKGVIEQLRCTVCPVNWRSKTTTLCRHFVCCKHCLQQTNGTIWTCVVCRAKVESSFPVEFHSSKLLKDLDIPFPLTAIIIKDELLQALLEMGFPESNIRRAIYLIQLQNNTEEQPDLNVVLDFMISNPSLVGLPLAEEMHLLLDDRNLDDTVKSRLCDYLEAIKECMACRCNVPSICLIPCSHLTLCRECFDRQPRPLKCPDCGMPIDNQVDVYLP